MTDMHFINGVTCAGTSGRAHDVYNPATGSVIASVPLASVDEVGSAVMAAKAAQPAWAIRHRQARSGDVCVSRSGDQEHR